jgi:hypothetical protein
MYRESAFGRIRSYNDGWMHVFRIRKKYDWTKLVFFAIIIGFLSGMDFLTDHVKAQAQEDSGNFFFIFELIIKGIGSLLIIAIVFDLLKRERIELSPQSLNLKTRLLGLTTSSKSYDLSDIKEMKEAPEPERGWKKTRSYDGTFNSDRSYSIDVRRVFPSLQFSYNGRTILFAEGLSKEEARYLLNELTLTPSGFAEKKF